METLAFILSTLGTVCICIPPLIKGKNMKLILLLVFFANAFVALSYFFTNAFNGAATCCLGAIQTVVNYFFEKKEKNIPKWLIVVYALSFAAVNIVVFSHVTDIVPLLAAFIFVIGISVKSGKKYRLWSLINTLLWILYDCLTLSFGPLITHAIQLFTIIFGMFVHDRKTSRK